MKTRLIFLINVGVFLVLSLFTLYFLLFADMIQNYHESSAQGDDIAVFFPGDAEYFDQQRQGIECAARQHQLKVRYYNADWDSTIQSSQIKQAFKKDYRALAICSVQTYLFNHQTLFKGAVANNIFSFTNRTHKLDSTAERKPVAHVGRNEIESGHLLHHSITQHFNPEQHVQIALIEGAPGTSPQVMRTEGFLNAMQSTPQWRIKHQKTILNWDTSLVKNHVIKHIEHFAQVDVIAVHWSKGAEAVANVFKRMKLTDPPLIVTLEYTPSLAEYLDQQLIASSTYVPIAEEGYRLIDTIDEFLSTQQAPAAVTIEQHLINSSNYRQVIAKNRFECPQ